jgi:hypothetical protein
MRGSELDHRAARQRDLAGDDHRAAFGQMESRVSLVILVLPGRAVDRISETAASVSWKRAALQELHANSASRLWNIGRRVSKGRALRNDFGSDTKAARIKDRDWPAASRGLDRLAYPRHIQSDD